MSKFITMNREELPESTFVREHLSGKTYNFCWKIRFNNELDPKTVNNTTMFVTTPDGGMFNCKISYNAMDNIIEIHPLEEYAPNTQYTLTITTRVVSLTGSRLPNDISVPFSID